MEQHHLLTLWDLLPPELQDYIYRLSICQLKFETLCRVRWRKLMQDPWHQTRQDDLLTSLGVIRRNWSMASLEEGCCGLGFAN